MEQTQEAQRTSEALAGPDLFGNKGGGAGVDTRVEAGAPTRELVFCPTCYRLEPVEGPCCCAESAACEGSEDDPGRFAAAIDAPRPRRPPGQRDPRLIPALASVGVLVLVTLIAVIVS